MHNASRPSVLGKYHNKGQFRCQTPTRDTIKGYKMKNNTVSAIFAVVFACGGVLSPLAANAAQYKSEYSLSLLGLSLGKRKSHGRMIRFIDKDSLAKMSSYASARKAKGPPFLNLAA